MRFQCSSASRKFLNCPSWTVCPSCWYVSVLFSEPKIPQFSRAGRGDGAERRLFQCSSASRKFLKSRAATLRGCSWCCFSALQRAENSSNEGAIIAIVCTVSVSVLFSEPKIPQLSSSAAAAYGSLVSVLFSEPKIPQGVRGLSDAANVLFQCSSASRKFLNRAAAAIAGAGAEVSVLFSEPKIPQLRIRRRRWWIISVSVLFSEPKIPQLMVELGLATEDGVSVLFSEPKIPQSRPSHLRPSIFPTAMITLRHS